MRVLLLLTALMFVGGGLAQSQIPSPAPSKDSKVQERHPSASNENLTNNPTGTDKKPFVIKSFEAEKTAERTEQDRPEREEKAANERRLVFWTIVLSISTIVLAGIAGGQLWAFSLQARRLRETVEATKSLARDAKESATDQATKMQTSLDIAQQSADAAEMLANTMKDTAERQLRAYLSVMVGTALSQDRAQGRKFKGMPRVINMGQTPAHKVAYNSNAAIMPSELPVDFTFPLPGETSGSGVLGPHQTFDMGKAVVDFCPDAEVDDIKIGKGKILYIWGIITYTDVFGNPWHTKFCQSFTFARDGEEEIVFGFYNDRHNDAK